MTEKTNILLRYLHQQWDKKVKHVGLGAGPRGGTQCPAGAVSWGAALVAGRLSVQVAARAR